MLPLIMRPTWIAGFSQIAGSFCINLATTEQKALIYTADHTCIVHDYHYRSQRFLVGHVNKITSLAVSSDKSWAVTADNGPNTMIIVWDIESGAPIRSFALDEDLQGACRVDISSDDMFIAILSNADTENDHQQLSLWDWEAESDSPVVSRLIHEVIPDAEAQTSMHFHPHNSYELVTNGNSSVIFWSWSEKGLSGQRGYVPKRDFSCFPTDFYDSILLGNGSEKAISCTATGKLVIWDPASGGETSMVANRRHACRLVQINQGDRIRHMSCIEDKTLVLGSDDGCVRFYDLDLRLVAWFEDIHRGPVIYVSFSSCPPEIDPHDQYQKSFSCPNFTVTTLNGSVVNMESKYFSRVNPDSRSGNLILDGISGNVTSIAVHPTKPIAFVASNTGTMKIFNLKTKSFLCSTQISSYQKLDAKDKTGVDWSVTCSSFLNVSQNQVSNSLGVGDGSMSTLSSILDSDLMASDSMLDCVVVGTSNGSVVFFHIDNLKRLHSTRQTECAISEVRVSITGRFIAAADTNFRVHVWKCDRVLTSMQSLLKLDANMEMLSRPQTADINFALETASKLRKIDPADYNYLGRVVCSRKKCVGLQFIVRNDGSESLISVAEDQTLTEIDAEASSYDDGIIVKNNQSTKIEVPYSKNKPTCVTFIPRLSNCCEEEGKTVDELTMEDFLLISMEDYKFRCFDVEGAMLRRCCQCPAFGGPIKRMELIGYRQLISRNLDKTITDDDFQPQLSYMVYGTSSRVIGIMQLPPIGDMNRAVSVIAHTGSISGLGLTSMDGNTMVLSSSGDDSIVTLWDVDLSNMQEHVGNMGISNKEQQNAILQPNVQGGQEAGLTENQWLHAPLHRRVDDSYLPFYQQFDDGGLGGSVHNDAENMFTLLQLLSCTKNSRIRRKLGNTIQLSALPSFFQLLGYYPSQSEIKEILNELRYANFSQSGVLADSVSIDEAVQTYVCRRPVFGIQRSSIVDALSTICGDEGISWQALCKILTTRGEAMSESELKECIGEMLGDGASELLEGTMIDASDFCDKILGLEDDTMVADLSTISTYSNAAI